MAQKTLYTIVGFNDEQNKLFNKALSEINQGLGPRGIEKVKNEANNVLLWQVGYSINISVPDATLRSKIETALKSKLPEGWTLVKSEFDPNVLTVRNRP